MSRLVKPHGGGELKPLLLEGAAREAELARAQSLTKIKLTGLADGVTWIDLGSEPDYQRNFVGRNFGTLDVTVQGACIAVGDAQCSTVPEPATYALAALAFAGALGARRRRRD